MRYFVAALALLLFTACSGGDADSSSESGDEPTPVPPASTASQPTTSELASNFTPTAEESSGGDEDAALRANVQAYSDAFLTGDGDTAYGLITERCQARMARDDFVSLVSQAKDLYGSALQFKTYKAEINVSQARVTYTYDISAINQTQEPWALESGSWHNDDC
jgi:hypothetical protein